MGLGPTPTVPPGGHAAPLGQSVQGHKPYLVQSSGPRGPDGPPPIGFVLVSFAGKFADMYMFT